MAKSSSGREKFSRFKGVILFLSNIVKIFPKSIRRLLWDIIQPFNSILFIGIRYILARSLAKDCGDNVRIGPNVQIINWDKLVLGSNVSIHANCYIDASGEIFIGDDVSIAHNTSILSSNHSWEDNDLPIKYNELIYASTIIKNDVWIGCGCRILGGVVVNTRSVVAAGSVVLKEVECHSVVGGIPARLLKKI